MTEQGEAKLACALRMRIIQAKAAMEARKLQGHNSSLEVAYTIQRAAYDRETALIHTALWQRERSE